MLAGQPLHVLVSNGFGLPLLPASFRIWHRNRDVLNIFMFAKLLIQFLISRICISEFSFSAGDKTSTECGPRLSHPTRHSHPAASEHPHMTQLQQPPSTPHNCKSREQYGHHRWTRIFNIVFVVAIALLFNLCSCTTAAPRQHDLL